jgi:hypothetical protein
MTRQDPAEFLKVAELLENDQPVTPTQGRHRTSAGRAYYASYLAIRETLRGIQSDSGYNLGHKTLVKFLEGHPDSKIRNLGQQLALLKKARLGADYDMAETLVAKKVRICLLTASGLLTKQAEIKATVKKKELPPHEDPGD